MTTDGRPLASLTAWERWELASFDEAESAPGTTQPGEPTQAPLNLANETNHLREIAQEEGYQEGFDAGHQAGLIAGEEKALAEGRLLSAQLTQIITRFETGISEIEHAVADDLLALALDVARKVIHQTLATQPQITLAVIHDALAQIPLQDAVIRLHPADVSLIDSLFGQQLAQTGHRVQEDNQLTRGDVIIQAGNTYLDARLATRWQHTMAALGQNSPWETPEIQDMP